MAVVAAVVLAWRCHPRSDTPAAGAPGATGNVWRAGSGGHRRAPPAAAAGASLSGTVSDAATRAPIAGAEVCADGAEPSDEGPREPACATSDAAGRYRIANLTPARYSVEASARQHRPAIHHPGGDREQRSVALAAGEARTGIDIALRPGGVQITGTVADLTGGPIAQARVRSTGIGDRVRAQTESDDRGRFSLWVSPGTVVVGASADGYAPQDSTGMAPGTFDLQLTPEASVAGTVVDGATGQPVAGAHVTVSGDAPASDTASTVAGPDGAYQVAGLGPGRYVATAHTDHGYGRTEGSLLVGLGQHVDGVTVRLSRAARVEGKVVIAATRQPCPDASVVLRDRDRLRPLVLRPIDGGLAITGVPPGTYVVVPRCRGFAPRQSYPPLTVADRDITDLVWEVDAGATLRGKVTTRAGELVDGARITARPSAGGRGSDLRVGWSGDDASYELSGLRPGAYRIEVSSQRAPAPPDGFSVEIADAAVVERDLVLDDGGTIAGTVVDTEGKPVGGMYITVPTLTARRSFLEGGCRSDDRGAFHCAGIPPGEHRVVAQASQFAELRRPGDAAGQPVTVQANQVATVKLVVEARSGAIRGTVVDGDGKPVGDAFVSAAREGEGPSGRAMAETRWSWGVRPNLTATDGSFTVPGLAAGAYTLRAYRMGGGEAIAEHAATGSTVKLQITAPGSIEGTARHAGAPVASLSVSVRNPKTWFSRDEQFYQTAGHYIVRDLPAGHLQITVEADGARTQTEIDLAQGEHRTVDVQLDDLVTVTGRVVEKGTTTPVAGVRMIAHVPGSPMRPALDDDGSTSDARGRFTLRNVSRGKIVLMGIPSNATDRSRGLVSAQPTIEGSGTVDIGDVELGRPGR